MIYPSSGFLTLVRCCLILGVGLFWTATASGQKFFPDDPLLVDDDSLVDAGTLDEHKLSDYYDFILNSFYSDDGPPMRAADINTLGEVPVSSWFQNRHGMHPMTIEKLARGPDSGDGPADGIWTVIDAKTEGVTPGFNVRDSEGDVYVIKFDPPENAEMATAAELISTKFFYAMGYNVPENYLVFFSADRLDVDPEAAIANELGKERPMNRRDLDDILDRVHQLTDGTYRAIASKFLDGSPLGPFKYEGTRSDDPNDVFPHEDRRELRGLRVLASWLNHDDSRSINTLDMLVERDGRHYIRHHLIDFGSSLGSGSVGKQSYRAGWEYIWEPKATIGRILTLGLWDREWVRIKYPDLPSIGRFESKRFRPDKWRPEYPNPAFQKTTPEDTYWGAKIVMAFTNAQIRAIVKTGRLSDAGAEAYLIQRLVERRDKIGRHWFGLVNTADRFRLTPDGELAFDRLASEYSFDDGPSDTGLTWSRFDNQTGNITPLGSEISYGSAPVPLPDAVRNSDDGSYFRARLREGSRNVDVYVRNVDGRLEIIGIERGRL